MPLRSPFSALIGVILLVLAVGALAQSPDLPEKADVRLIVDISGSMKENDPANLRKPAVRLVTELLPEGSEAGVWTFGQYVNMLVPYGEVDDQWRAKARERSSEINSVALHTNIGEALEVASDDFYQSGGFENTHFILLTDGMVDIPGGEQADLQERSRILGEVLQRFKDKNAKIHPVALSENADKALLERLAVETGGSFQIAVSDADLSRAFLEAFSSAAPVEEVPIEKEGFTIDGTIDEFTALIFRGDGQGPVKLSAPNGVVWDAQNHPDNVRWLAADDYTLVTVTEPAEGTWTLAEVPGPGSRIKVVSDLRMGVTDLPNYFYATDTLNLDIAFYEKNERLTDPDFLSVIEVRVMLETEDGRTGTKVLSDPDEVPDDGTYHDTISKLRQPGEYTFTFTADGQTFQRQQRQTLTLKAPFDLETQGQGSGESAQYEITLLARNPSIINESVEARARITAPDDSESVSDFEKSSEAGAWTLSVTPQKGEGVYSVAFDITARTEGGEAITYSPGTFDARFPRDGEGVQFGTIAPPVDENEAEPLPGAQEPDPAEEKPEPEPAPEPAPEPEEPAPEPVPEPEPEPEPAPEETTAEEDAGTPLWIWAASGGALLVIIAGAAVFFIKRRKAQAAAKEALESEDSDESVSEEAAALAAAVESSETESDDEQEAEAEEQSTEESPEESEQEEEPEKKADEKTQQAAEELEQVMTDLEDETRSEKEAPSEEAADEHEVPTLEEEPEVAESEPDESESDAEPDTEKEPAPEAEPEEAAEEQGEDEKEAEKAEEASGEDMDAEALADQILSENEEDDSDEDEFSLEDFDISDVDDLPSEDEDEDEKKNDKKE